MFMPRCFTVYYEAHDPAVHIPAGCASDSTCYFAVVLAHHQVLFAHVVAIMNPEVIQEQQMVCIQPVMRGYILISWFQDM